MFSSEFSVPVRGGAFVVTGGSGFVGSHVVDGLVAGGAREIVVLDLSVQRRNIEAAEASVLLRVVEADVRDREAVADAVRGVDGIFHLAVLPLGACTSDPRLCLEVNVVGTFNVLEAARDAGVRKIVYSSASSVYGDTHATMDESHPLGARTMYGASKLSGEYLMRAFQAMNGLGYVTLRYMNVYGPRQTGGLVMAVLDRLLEGEPPSISGDGGQSFDFVHVADVAEANLRAMEAGVSGVELNVGSGGEATVREIVERLIAITGAGLEPEYRTDEAVLMTRRVGSNRRAREELGWEPARDLDAGLRDVVAWRTSR